MYGFTINCDGNAIEQLRKIDKALADAGVNAKANIGQVESSFEGLGEKAKEVFGNIKNLLLGGFAGFEVFQFLKDSKDEYDEVRKSITRVETALRSTHYAAGLTNNALNEQAKEMNKNITDSLASIEEAEGMQLSFTNIRGPMFKETMDAVADFAEFYHEDLNSAALQVDKAVNDPAQGFRRLMREGVTFTAEQEKQIKNYEKQGQLAKAQEIVLAELRREFGGQAKAFSLTGEGREKMDAKQWEDIKFEIGEVISKIKLSLLPLFGDIRNYLQQAFESGPMQFFIAHLKDLLSITMKLLPIWLTYKGILLTTSLITSAFSIKNGILTASIGELTVMTDGATVATEGFGAALVSVGIGAFAVGIGLVIEKLMSMNQQLDEAIDKKYKLSENKDYFKTSQEQLSSIRERMQVMNSLGTQAKQSLLADIQQYIASANEKMPLLKHRESDLLKGAIGYELNKSTGIKSFLGANEFRSLTDSTWKTGYKTKQAFTEMQNNMSQFTSSLPELQKALKTLTAAGVKPLKGGGYGNSGMQDNSTDISELSGAKGGLGEAKIININFHDALQKINVADGKGVVDSGQKAVEFIISSLQNFAYAQSNTH